MPIERDIIDYLSKFVEYLSQKPSREAKIATQKLEEAVFWLTYEEE